MDLAGIRAVFLDAVGTLIVPHPSAAETYAVAGRQFGSRLDVSAIRRRFRDALRTWDARDEAVGWRTDEAREERRWRNVVGQVFAGEISHNAIDACFAELFAHFGRPEAWRVIPETAVLVRSLTERGLVVGVGSNYDRRLHAVLDGFPELAPVKIRVISSEVGWRKPAPEFFAAVARAAGCASGAILFVGDDERNDLEGASQAGLRVMPWPPLKP